MRHYQRQPPRLTWPVARQAWKRFAGCSGTPCFTRGNSPLSLVTHHCSASRCINGSDFRLRTVDALLSATGRRSGDF